MAVRIRFRRFYECETEAERQLTWDADSLIHCLDTGKYYKIFLNDYVEVPADEVIFQSPIPINKISISGVSDGSRFLRDDGAWANPPGGGADNFTELLDVPSSYTTHSLKGVRVNAGETGLEFYNTAPTWGSITGTIASQTDLMTWGQPAQISAPTYTTPREMHDITRSSGQIAGGNITVNSGTLVDISAGQGLIRATAGDLSTLYSIDWAANTAVNIPNDTIRYVKVDYNAGSPITTITATEDYDYQTGFPLGYVINEGGSLYINDTPHAIGRGLGRALRRNYEVDGRTRAHQLGGLILGNPATLKVSITSGVTWFRGIRETFSGLDTGVSGSFDSYYYNGTNWIKVAAQTDLDNLQYNNTASGLATLGTNNYVSHWFYLGPSNQIVMIYGQGNHNTQAQAEAEQPPSLLPLRLQVGAILLGKIVVKKSAGTATSSLSVFNTVFSGAGATIHNDLSGLNTGDYMHLTAAEYAAVTNTETVNETPTGAINGANTVFTTSTAFTAGKTKVYLNGLRQRLGGGNDYTETGPNEITFSSPPQTGDVIIMDYI